MALTESQALAIVRAELGTAYRSASARAKVRVGLGDDSAVLGRSGEDLGRSGEDLVWTIDSCGEGSHFLWDWLSPEDIAWKSLHAAVSDVPAMGARPIGALCQVSASPRVTKKWFQRFVRAQREASLDAKCPIVGGNFSSGPRFEVVTTVIGGLPTAGAILRSGARPGDELWLVGSVGLARAGLLILQSGISQRGDAAQRCLDAFRRPRARMKDGPRLVGRATACLDVSDGLVRDAKNLSAASGVRVVLDGKALEEGLPDALRTVAPRLGVEPLELALEGGEDYALLATGPGPRRPRFARVIGFIEKGSEVFLLRGGVRRRLSGGFEHR